MANVVDNCKDVIKAFNNMQPLRTRKIKVTRGWNGWAYHARDYEGVRDEVKVELNGIATYYLWGSPIAILKGKTLTLDNGGYTTLLTAKRIQNIYNVLVGSWWDGSGSKYLHYNQYGFYFGWRYDIVHPFPIKINIKTGRVVSKFNKTIYLRKLSRAISIYTINDYIEICKYLNIPIPQDIQDKITEKRFKGFLRAA